MPGPISSWVDRLFNQHKLMRRGYMLWAILAASLSMYFIIPRIEGDIALVSALTEVLALLGTAGYFYHKSRDREVDNVRSRDTSEDSGRSDNRDGA